MSAPLAMNKGTMAPATRAVFWQRAALLIFVPAIVFLCFLVLPSPGDAAGRIVVASLLDPTKPRLRVMEEFMAIGDRIGVEVTAYSSESPETGTITASGQKVRRGIIAVSRDLEAVYGLKFGDLVEIEGVGTFEVQDRMNKRWTKRVDIWFPTERECINFGKQNRTLLILGRDTPEGRKSCEG